MKRVLLRDRVRVDVWDKAWVSVRPLFSVAGVWGARRKADKVEIQYRKIVGFYRA